MSGFMEYRKNKRTAKRELAKMMANTLPGLNRFGSGLSDVTDWIMQLVEGSKYITLDHVWDYAIDKLAEVLETNNSRLKRMAIWFFSLDGDEMSRVIGAAAMATNEEWHVVNNDEEDSDKEDTEEEAVEEEVADEEPEEETVSDDTPDIAEDDGSDE